MKLSKKQKETRSKIFFSLKVILSFVFLYVLFTKFIDIKKVVFQITQIKYYFLILCLLIALLILFLQALRWKTITKYYKKEISIKDSILYYLRGTYYGSITPAKAGSYIRGYDYSKKYRIKKFDGFFSVFLERIFDIFLPLAFICIYLLLGKSSNTFLSLFIVFLIISIAWFIAVLIIKYLIKPIRKLRFLRKISLPIVLFDWNLFFNGFLTSLIWLCYVLIGFIVLYSMNIHNIPLYYLFYSVCVATIVVSIPITLNGWGIREGTYVLLLSAYIDANTTLVFSVISLLLNTYFISLIGLVLEFTKFKKN